MIAAEAESSLRGDRYTLQNDSVTDFSQVAIVGNFVPYEEVGVMLTSPCDGSIVEIHILWWEGTSGHPQTIESALRVYEGSTFPNPGTVKMDLEAPTLTPGFFNVFAHMDEAQAVPMDIPVTTGEQFIVTLEFDNPTDVGNGGPSVVRDLDGCVLGRNILKEATGGWMDFCPCVLWAGDVAMRAVVECAAQPGACCTFDEPCEDDVDEENCQAGDQTFFSGMICEEVNCPEPTGACCFGGGCLTDVEENACVNGIGGVYAGHGTDCDDNVCDPGACCQLDGSCSVVLEAECDQPGAVFSGPNTTCDPNPCEQPLGACCLGTYCQGNQYEANCVTATGVWAGPFTNCFTGLCPVCDDGDYDRDGDVDLVDFAWMQRCLGDTGDGLCKCLDLNNDNIVDLSDFELFTIELETAGP